MARGAAEACMAILPVCACEIELSDEAFKSRER
jgi:hypothetical protein